MSGEEFGPYRLDGLIGRGGMGEVHRAFDTVKERVVALKRLPPHLADDTDYQARFRRESKVAARLREPHVIPIHDFGEIDGRLYIDMRLVEGVDVGTLVERDGPIAPARAVGIVAQVASALDAAHADRLVHRDVKPSNVLVSRTGVDEDYVYLVDFGIAQDGLATTITATGAAIGTIAYMAPERFVHGRGDHRVDVYSLACLLHEMLTGAKPFGGDSLPSQMYAHVNSPPPRPSTLLGTVPVALDGVVARGMAKDPQERYRTAGDLAVAARDALRPAPAPRPTPLPQPLPPQPLPPHAVPPQSWPAAPRWASDPSPAVTTTPPEPPGPAAGHPAVRPAPVEPDPASSRSWRRPPRWLVVAVAVVVLLGGVAALTRAWVQQQYYVGLDSGQVVIFQGVQGEFLGLSLDQVTERSDISVSDLAESDRGLVAAGILTDGLEDARRVVERFRDRLLPPCPAGVAQVDPLVRQASPVPPTLSPAPTSPTTAPTTRPTAATPSPRPAVPSDPLTPAPADPSRPSPDVVGVTCRPVS